MNDKEFEGWHEGLNDGILMSQRILELAAKLDELGYDAEDILDIKLDEIKAGREQEDSDLELKRYDGFIHDESDSLPENHPLAHETVFCEECRKMIHAGNNEFMTAWVELLDENLCVDCWYQRVIDGSK